MSRCPDTGRPGCRGMLCRSAHASLRRLPVMRYPADDCGRADTSAQPEEGWVCALISYLSDLMDGALDLPGIAGGQQAMHLTVAAGSFDVPLAAGDRLTVNGGLWRVTSVTAGRCLTAGLVPEGDEPWV